MHLYVYVFVARIRRVAASFKLQRDVIAVRYVFFQDHTVRVFVGDRQHAVGGARAGQLLQQAVESGRANREVGDGLVVVRRPSVHALVLSLKACCSVVRKGRGRVCQRQHVKGYGFGNGRRGSGKFCQGFSCGVGFAFLGTGLRAAKFFVINGSKAAGDGQHHGTGHGINAGNVPRSACRAVVYRGRVRAVVFGVASCPVHHGNAARGTGRACGNFGVQIAFQQPALHLEAGNLEHSFNDSVVARVVHHWVVAPVCY